MKTMKRLVMAVLATGLLGANVQAAFLTPVDVTASASYSGAPVIKLIDNSGLSANNAAGTHDNQEYAESMWMSNGGTVANEWVVFDLGGVTNLSTAYIWQMNQGHTVNAGGARNTRTLDIYVSSDNVSYARVGGTVTLGVADGSNAALPAEAVPLTASNVRYVKFDILTIGSGDTSGYVGLSEVRFEGEAPSEGPISFSDLTASNITTTAASLHATVSTNLTASSLVWDTTDKGTTNLSVWSGTNSLGAQSAGPVTGSATNLSADTGYVFRFYGEDGTTNGWSAAETFATALTEAQNPAFTNAVALNAFSVELMWTDNANTETGYILQRSDSGSGGTYATVATLGANVTTYTDATVSPSTTYYYRLAATNAVNGSSTDPAACQTSGVTTPVAPTHTTFNQTVSTAWNTAGNWSDIVPEFTIDATIASNKTAVVNSADTPSYTGSLTLQSGATIDLWNNAADYNALGSGMITLNSGARILIRLGGTLTIANDIDFAGDASILNYGNSTDNKTRTLSGIISGSGQCTYSMRRGNNLYLSGANPNTWSGGIVVNFNDTNFGNPSRLRAHKNGAFGTGDVTVNDGISLVIASGLNGTIDHGASLYLNGPGANEKLQLGSNEQVFALYIDDVQQADGVYDSSEAWLAGTGKLTVKGPPAGTVFIFR